jgi:hypothetical protein
MAEAQAGFRKGKGTRDQTANMRWIIEKAKEYGKIIFMCFIDYSKAFDCVDHSQLWETLRSMGVPEHLTVIIKSLYVNQEAAVRMEHSNTDWFEVRKGVRQGCILSPYLFNLYSEYIRRRVGLEDEKGIRIGGRNINNLRYADDTTILAERKRDLAKILKKLKAESEKAGMRLNLKKTKMMTTGNLNKFKLDGTEIETIDSYTFLGTIITRDGSMSKEINRSGRLTMIKLEKIMKDRDVMATTKSKIVETMIFPIVTYGSESWTLRKMLKTPWTDRRTNASIIEEVKPTRSLEATVTQLILWYFGHVTRTNGTLEQDIMIGEVDGSRRQGRPRLRWIDNIKKITGFGLEKLKEIVKDRNKWRRLVKEKGTNKY